VDNRFQIQFFDLTLRPCSKRAMMKAFAEDGIEIGKLTDGAHTLSWHLDARFFEAFEGSLIKDGSIDATLNLERAEGVFRSTLVVKGEVKTSCDNCLEEIPMTIQNDLDFVIKLTEVPAEDDTDNEVFYVQDNDPRFFVSQHIYDLVHLGLPLRKTCEAPGNTKWCNQELLDKMHDDEQNDDEDGNDPRWDKLKDLFK